MQVKPLRLCDGDFGITTVDDSTIGINCSVFCFHIAHISFASSWYLLCFSVIVLVRLCVFGIAVSIKLLLFFLTSVFTLFTSFLYPSFLILHYVLISFSFLVLLLSLKFLSFLDCTPFLSFFLSSN